MDAPPKKLLRKVFRRPTAHARSLGGPSADLVCVRFWLALDYAARSSGFFGDSVTS